MALVNQWCQIQPYRTKESPAVDIAALPAEVEEAPPVPETDALYVDNLNAARMARQPLPSRGGNATGKRPAGGAQAGNQAGGTRFVTPARPQKCNNCGGSHRLKFCPKNLSDKDA